MAKKKKVELLTKEQEKQLQDMVNGMLDIASELVDEYDDVDLEDLQILSGSITQVHETSPFLNELFEGDSWKRAMNSMHLNIKRSKEDTDNDASE